MTGHVISALNAIDIPRLMEHIPHTSISLSFSEVSQEIVRIIADIPHHLTHTDSHLRLCSYHTPPTPQWNE